MSYSRGNYRCFAVPKKSGKLRYIEEPFESLKQVQRAHIPYLSSLPWTNCIYGLGGEQKNSLFNATTHYGSSVIVKADLREFFQSTTVGHYLWAISILVSKGILSKAQEEKLLAISEDCFIRDKFRPQIVRLPTGAPTSPFISSICFWPADLELMERAKENGLTYTRYVDDLTFSGSSYPLGWQKIVAQVVGQYGYQLNFEKSELCYRSSASQVVTGVLLNNIPVPTREYQNNLRAILDHYARENKALDQYVQGKLGYLKQLCPDKFYVMIGYYNKRRARYGFIPIPEAI